MIRQLARWIVRDEIRQLEMLAEAAGDAAVRARDTVTWLRGEIARRGDGCVERPMCARHTAELETLKTKARAE